MASLPGSRTAGFIASPPAVSKPCGLPFASVVSTFPAPSGKPKLHETSALMSIPGEELHIRAVRPQETAQIGDRYGNRRLQHRDQDRRSCRVRGPQDGVTQQADPRKTRRRVPHECRDCGLRGTALCSSRLRTRFGQQPSGGDQRGCSEGEQEQERKTKPCRTDSGIPSVRSAEGIADRRRDLWKSGSHGIDTVSSLPAAPVSRWAWYLPLPPGAWVVSALRSSASFITPSTASPDPASARRGTPAAGYRPGQPACPSPPAQGRTAMLA